MLDMGWVRWTTWHSIKLDEPAHHPSSGWCLRLGWIGGLFLLLNSSITLIGSLLLHLDFQKYFETMKHVRFLLNDLIDSPDRGKLSMLLLIELLEILTLFICEGAILYKEVNCGG